MATLAESFPLKDTTIRIPSRGLGTFQPDPKLYPNGSVKASVLHAIKTGYRHIDTALAYEWGNVEKEVGEAIRESGIPRSEFFIVTKLHQCFHNPEDVEPGMDMSLKNLGMDYVDLYLMHFPYAYVHTENYGTKRYPDKKPVIDYDLSRSYDVTWTAMEKLVDMGKTRLIGVSNFSKPKLQKLMASCRIFPVVNQIELNPYFPQKDHVEFCQRHGIHVTAYGPLGCKPASFLVGRKGIGPLEDPKIKRIAAKHSRTPAQVILSYMISIGVSVIPKSNDPERIRQNFDCLFELSREETEEIALLMGPRGERGVRNLDLKDYLGFDPFNEDVEEP